MTEKTERLSVELNDAFARLEQAQDSPESGSTIAGEKKRNSKIEQPARSGTQNVLGVLTGLIAMGIASYAAFNTYQLKTSQPVEVVTSAEVDRKIATLRLELEQTIQGSADGQSRVEDQLEEFSRLQQVSVQRFEQRVLDRLEQSLSEVREDIGTSSEDWLLAEAEYLIRLGSHRVLMEGDAQGAVALFEAADGIVRDAIGLSAFDLR